MPSGNSLPDWPAQVVEVSKNKTGGVTVDKVYCVIDLGTVVNPDTVKAQIEGSVAMALTAATKEGITFEKGQAVQANFDANQMLRINEMPEWKCTFWPKAVQPSKALVSRAYLRWLLLWPTPFLRPPANASAVYRLI